MLRPHYVQAVNTLMHSLQSRNFITGQLFFRHHYEIAIAMGIKITHRERTLQVGTDEIGVGVQDLLHAVD